MKYRKEKKAIIEAGRKLWQAGLVAANDGNISVRVNDIILTTPTGVSKGELTYNMILPVSLSGEVLVKSQYRPSSELKMHLAVYKKRPDIYAVVHAHPPYATAFAVTGESLSLPILSEIVLSLGEIPIAPYGTPSTEEVPQSIEPFLENHKALLLANHGALTWGKNLREAFFHMESAEHIAKISFLAKLLGTPKVIPENKIEELKQIKTKFE